MGGMSNTVVKIQPSDPEIIAPCGLDCGLCRAYLRDRKPCPGCRSGESNKSKACLACAIRNCEQLAFGRRQFCFSCAKYPCAELRRLDARYRASYQVSVIDNLTQVRTIGVKRFVAAETSRWSCANCGARLCMHEPRCGTCGHAWQGEG